MRRIIVFVCFLLLAAAMVHPAFAHKGPEHYKEIELVLFHDSFYSQKVKGSILESKIRILEYSTQIALDQFNGNYGAQLEMLRQAGVKGLPKNTILSKDEGGINIPPSKHRSYTHRGWNYTYQVDKANWNVRRQIMLNSADVVFHFVNDKQRDAFCALLYYVHILGDQMEDSKEKSEDIVIPLKRKTSYESNPDILFELKKYIPLIMLNRDNSGKLGSLIYELSIIEDKADAIVSSGGGIRTDEDRKAMDEYANKTIDVLSEFIPGMLKNESFFRKAFYG